MESGISSVNKALPTISNPSYTINNQKNIPVKEHSGSSQSKLMFCPEWDQLLWELSSSDKIKPPASKSKIFQIPRRSVNVNKNGDGSPVSTIPLKDREINLGGQTHKLTGKSVTKIADPSPITSVEASMDFLDPAKHSGSHNIDVVLFPDSSGLNSQHNHRTILQTGDGKSDHQSTKPVRPDTNVEPVLELSSNILDSVNVPHTNDTYCNKPTILALSPHLPSCAQAKIMLLPEDSNLSLSSNSEQRILETHQDALSSVSTYLSDNIIQSLNHESARTTPCLEIHTQFQSLEHELVESWNKIKSPSEPGSFSLINRQRPMAVNTSLKRIPRKEVPSSSPIFTKMSTTDIMKSQDWQGISKSLPQTPTQRSSHDLATKLQAHLDNLSHRRRNISCIVRQMTEYTPQDSLLISDESRNKREQEKRRIKLLLEEEADIRREEYEVGLRLHRAWKRSESGFVYEPTSLWVRRVTG